MGMKVNVVADFEHETFLPSLRDVWWNQEVSVADLSTGHRFHPRAFILVGGWVPTHLKNINSSNWIIAAGRGENQKNYFKPPPFSSWVHIWPVDLFLVNTGTVNPHLMGKWWPLNPYISDIWRSNSWEYQRPSLCKNQLEYMRENGWIIFVTNAKK